MNKNALPIILGIFLFITQSYTNSCSGILPVFEFKPYEKIQDNLIHIKILQHDIQFKNDLFTIKSKWNFIFKDGSKMLPELVIASNLSNIKLLSTQVNGEKIDPVKIPDFKNYYLLKFENPIIPNEEVSLTMEYEINDRSGSKLILFTANDLFHIARICENENGILGHDLRSRIDLDYSDIIKTAAKFEESSHYFTFCSNYPPEQPVSTGMFTVGFANSNHFGRHNFNVENTNFQLYYSKQTMLMAPNLVENIILDSWPLFLQKFPKPTNSIVFIENPYEIFGAGPKGSNVFSINIAENIPENVQGAISSMFGVPKCTSTKEVVDNLYKDSNAPWKEYLTNLIIHELGHLFFGFGWTVERHPYFHDYWFSLALGMLYDREISKQLTGRFPPIFDLATHYWENNLKNNNRIDQRLIQPDLKNDEKEGISSFHRSQYFAHGKGLYVLNKIRIAIGSELFDQEVIQYLNKGTTNKDGYISFRERLLKHYKNLGNLEKQLQIY